MMSSSRYAIFRGRRFHVISETEETVCLEPIAASAARIDVSKRDPDLIVHPTADDLHLAEAFERGEVGAFEYADGHTYPPGQEIPPRKKSIRRTRSAARVH